MFVILAMFYFGFQTIKYRHGYHVFLFLINLALGALDCIFCHFNEAERQHKLYRLPPVMEEGRDHEYYAQQNIY